MTTTPEIIRRYFDLAAQPDLDAYLALFADDAVVLDENRTHAGSAAIRAWRQDAPLVTYEITDVASTAEGTVVTATITGDFPGSPFAGLRYRFEEYDADRIRRLRIAP